MFKGYFLHRYKEMQSRVAELEKAHDEIKQQHAQYKVGAQ